VIGVVIIPVGIITVGSWFLLMHLPIGVVFIVIGSIILIYTIWRAKRKQR